VSVPLSPWLLAIRPKTLALSLSPLLLGGALAQADSGALHWLPWLAALCTAMLIQIATNLHNDAGDFARGADTPQRLGPARAAAQGWLSVTALRRAAYGCFGMALLLGGYLAWIGGLPILLLGLAALASGYAYTGGPRPIAYSPLGELFVLVFFGVAAVGGTYYLQTLSLSLPVLAAGIAAGLPAAAVLLVNNYRDLEADHQAGRRTLAQRLGRPASRRLYAAMLLLPLVLAPVFCPRPWVLLPALPLALWLSLRLWRCKILPLLAMSALSMPAPAALGLKLMAPLPC
jgi:1,4-dihydroxy-2-naphthoate polyprenyltransferase